MQNVKWYKFGNGMRVPLNEYVKIHYHSDEWYFGEFIRYQNNFMD